MTRAKMNSLLRLVLSKSAVRHETEKDAGPKSRQLERRGHGLGQARAPAPLVAVAVAAGEQAPSQRKWGSTRSDCAGSCAGNCAGVSPP